MPKIPFPTTITSSLTVSSHVHLHGETVNVLAYELSDSNSNLDEIDRLSLQANPLRESHESISSFFDYEQLFGQTGLFNLVTASGMKGEL